MTEPLTLTHRLRNMGPYPCEAAELAADEIDRLTEANKALLAENERLQSEWYEYRQFSIDYAVERDRATAAEAKLAKVEKERDDAVRWRTSAVACADRLSAELAEARRVIEPFAKAVIIDRTKTNGDRGYMVFGTRPTPDDYLAANSFLASKGE
jgi:hypothetical protein